MTAQDLDDVHASLGLLNSLALRHQAPLTPVDWTSPEAEEVWRLLIIDRQYLDHTTLSRLGLVCRMLCRIVHGVTRHVQVFARRYRSTGVSHRAVQEMYERRLKAHRDAPGSCFNYMPRCTLAVLHRQRNTMPKWVLRA